MNSSTNSFFIYVVLFIFNIFSCIQPIPAEYVTTSQEFAVPFNSTMGVNSLFTPYANVNGASFLVWVDANFRPQVTQKTSEGVLTIPLDPNPDFTCFPDAHHHFSMGIDKNGYIHITGNMHYYPSGPSGNDWLPIRYQNQNILYWISRDPLDITAGFSFAGGGGTSGMPNDPRSIYANGISYGRFFHSRTGDLYWAALVEAYSGNVSFFPGMMAVGLQKYNPTTKTWTALGSYPTPSTPVDPSLTPNKVLFWEEAGIGNWFQGYQSAFQFDNSNTLHFSTAVVANPYNQGNTRVLYAQSTDGGLTWKKANGQSIPGLPLRGSDASPNRADLVLDTGGAYYIEDYTAVAPDAAGKPAVLANGSWIRYDGTEWNNDISNGVHASGDHGLLGLDGMLTFNESNVIWLKRMNSFYQNSAPYHLQSYIADSAAHFFTWISDIGLYTTGSLYGVAVNDSSLNQLEVNRVTFTPGPLPLGWQNQVIGALNFGGSSDYTHGVFTLRAAGMGPGLGSKATTDQLSYTYMNLSGDGTIIARIANQHLTSPWYFDSMDGVMMRETLDEGSTFAMMGLSYKNGSRWLYRTSTNAPAHDNFTGTMGDPLWVKLTRTGNLFTGYLSHDGKTWMQQGAPVTINMQKNIYIGLAADGYTNNDVHQALVDNVSINGNPVNSVTVVPPLKTYTIVPTTPPPSLVTADPVMTLAPASTTISPGQSSVYTLTMTNKDSASVGPTNFLFYSNTIPDQAGKGAGVAYKISPSSVFAYPGQTVTVQVVLTADPTAPAQNSTVWVSADNVFSGRTGLAHSALTIVAPQACVPGNPTLTATPSSQTIKVGSKATFQISVTNTDSHCGASNFLFNINTIGNNTGSSSKIALGGLPSSLIIGEGATQVIPLQINAVSNTTSADSYTFWISCKNETSGKESLLSFNLTVTPN